MHRIIWYSTFPSWKVQNVFSDSVRTLSRITSNHQQLSSWKSQGNEKVANLIRAYEDHGHYHANVNPLRNIPVTFKAELEPQFHGLAGHEKVFTKGK